MNYSNESQVIKKFQEYLDNQRYKKVINDYDNLDFKYKASNKVRLFKAISLREQKELNQSNELFDEIYKENNLLPNLNYEFGLLKYNLGKFQEATFLFEKEININFNHINSYIFLSKSFVNLKEYLRSLKTLEFAIKKNPSIPNLYFELGMVFYEIDEKKHALKMFKKTLELNSNFKNAKMNIASCLQLLDQNEEALKYLLEELNNNPDNFSVNFNLGNIYREQGDFDQSEKYLKKCIKINPNHGEAYRSITVFKKIKDKKDPLLKIMLEKYSELKQKPEISADNLMHLAYGLSKIFEDLKDGENFFKYLNIANQLRRKQINFSIDNEMKQFSMLKKLFSNNFVKNFSKSNITNKFIFVLGMPRSGTTLTEQIIGSHPDVNSLGELLFIQKAVKKFFPVVDYEKFHEQVFKNLEKFKNDFGNYFISEVKSVSDKKGIPLDKLPFNFKFIGFILLTLPNSKIIHVTRNGKDTCFSILKNFFPGSNIGFAYDEKELKEYFILYKSLMKHWIDLFKDKIYEIKYENLVSNPNEEIKKLIQFCGLAWNDKCLKHFENKKSIKTVSTVQARQPIYQSSVNIWKKYQNFFSEDFLSIPE